MKELVRLSAPARPEHVAELRRAAREAALLVGADADAVELAVSEAASNVVVHAYRDRACGFVRLVISDLGDGLRVVIEDDGIGLAPRPDSPGMGLGLPTITSLCERVELDCSAGGSRVVMRFGSAE